MIIEVEAHFRALLEQEDTDGDRRITVQDRGPRCYRIGPLEIRGTYPLANLLQELALARQAGQHHLELDPALLYQAPTTRLSHSIRERCWSGLTRCLDLEQLQRVLFDPKLPDTPRLYLSPQDRESQDYYRHSGAEVILLKTPLTPEYVLSLNQRPGLLGLAFAQGPLPYLVPGGRFNEMYGWDSYFIALGLLQDGKLDLARNLLEHQLYQIQHYGQVLNANRSYYLSRSQPPFLTSFLRAILQHDEPPQAWVQRVLAVAMQEYAQVWNAPRRQTACGLNRYCASGIGLPPETEPGHFHSLLSPLAQAQGLELEEFERAYRLRQLDCPQLDDYFVHDRTVRESGHDTSYRLEGRAAHLCGVDLNSLLYRYEVDLEQLLQRYGSLPHYPGPEVWRARAQERRLRMNHYCWNAQAGQFFDYDFVQQRQTNYHSATNLWPLWASLATPEQARRAFEAAPIQPGGLAGSDLASRGQLGPLRPPRQWDFPYGWAPHQMLAWEGLAHYQIDPSPWVMAWLDTVTRNAVQYNGVIAEKYDVESGSHQVAAEYGNVGTDFDYLTREGFGWTNASYQVGLALLSPSQRQHLDRVALAEESA